jgi:hypothetical protein
VVKDKAYVREDSRVNAEIVTELAKGEIVEDGGDSNADWRSVYAPQAVAYIHESVLSLPTDLDQALKSAAERGEAAKAAWTEARATYDQFKKTLDQNREAALQLDWHGLAKRLDLVIAHHPDAEAKLFAQRLKDGVQVVVAAVDQVRQARGMSPLPQPTETPAAAVTAKPVEVTATEVKPTGATAPTGPAISPEQVRALQETAAIVAQYPAQGFVTQREHAQAGTSDALIDDDGKVVAYLKVKAGAEIKLPELYWRWVGVKGAVTARIDGVPVVEVEDAKLLKH